MPKTLQEKISIANQVLELARENKVGTEVSLSLNVGKFLYDVEFFEINESIDGQTAIKVSVNIGADSSYKFIISIECFMRHCAKVNQQFLAALLGFSD